jgi:hypothetical protein
MRSILFALSLGGALALALTLTLTASQPAVEAAPGKNLKIYPKDTDVAQIKKDMKTVSKSLGVQCDHCHELEQLDKDTPHKEQARVMMKMVASINDSLKKGGFKDQVTCMTCHQGKEKPPKK